MANGKNRLTFEREPDVHERPYQIPTLEDVLSRVTIPETSLFDSIIAGIECVGSEYYSISCTSVQRMQAE